MSPWLKVYDDLPRHPKTTRLCRALGADRNTVVGSLICLWSWASTYAQDGDLTRFTNQDIADAAGWEGDAGELVKAMKDSGFLDGRVIHNWMHYSGAYFHDKASGKNRNKKSLQNASESRGFPGESPESPPPKNKKEKEKEKDQEQERCARTPKPETVFSTEFWPLWPTGGARKLAQQRFLAASGEERTRILAAERHYVAAVDALAFTVRAENFVGGQRSYYEEWATGPPPPNSPWFSRNGNGKRELTPPAPRRDLCPVCEAEMVFDGDGTANRHCPVCS
jgi:hypothetical protein